MQYDLGPYARSVPAGVEPGRVVVDWIIRETGLPAWHGARPAVLSATRDRLLVYQTRAMHERVRAIVSRFVRPPQPNVTLQVAIFDDADPAWRRGLLHLLQPIYSGPQGQQVWLLAPEDLALVGGRLASRLQAGSDRQRLVKTPNGVPAELQWRWPVNYAVAAELSPGWQAAYRPVLRSLQQGLTLRITPLWTLDGKAIDLYLQIETSRVIKLHRIRSPAPLISGTQSTTADVPEVAATNLEHTVRCPLDRALLVSVGMQPGLLSRRTALSRWLPLSGSGGELLITIAPQGIPVGPAPLPFPPTRPQAARAGYRLR